MSENKNAKTPADGGAGCIDGVWYGTAPTANRAITLKEMQQWIATTWKRCQDEAWRQRVDLTYHGDGNVGIGTPPGASAPLVMGEPVERLRVMMSDQEPAAHVFAATERNKLAAWMMSQGYATGHGDSIEKLLEELEWQIEESVRNEREACAKVCDVLAVHPEYASDITKLAAQAIRARGEK